MKSKSISHVRQQFSLRFNHEAPCKRTIQCNVAKYCNFGTSLNRNKGSSGRSRSCLTLKEFENFWKTILTRVHGEMGWIYLYDDLSK